MKKRIGTLDVRAKFRQEAFFIQKKSKACFVMTNLVATELKHCIMYGYKFFPAFNPATLNSRKATSYA